MTFEFRRTRSLYSFILKWFLNTRKKSKWCNFPTKHLSSVPRLSWSGSPWIRNLFQEQTGTRIRTLIQTYGQLTLANPPTVFLGNPRKPESVCFIFCATLSGFFLATLPINLCCLTVYFETLVFPVAMDDEGIFHVCSIIFIPWGNRTWLSATTGLLGF